MECRLECGVCCIYISISSPIPGMPSGKPAGVKCVQLLDDFKCAIFDSKQRPEVCSRFKPELIFCGNTAEEAKKTAEWLMEK